MSIRKCKSGVQILDICPVLRLVCYSDPIKKIKRFCGDTTLRSPTLRSQQRQSRSDIEVPHWDLNQINFHDQNTGHICTRICMPDVVKTGQASARYSDPLWQVPAIQIPSVNYEQQQ